MIKTKHIFALISLFLFFFVSLSFSQSKKVRVIAEKANVYLEASEYSYLVETLEKGTILSLYGSGEIKGNWLNVFFKSEKWEGVVTGFIKASKVELLETLKTAEEEKNKLKKEEKSQVALHKTKKIISSQKIKEEPKIKKPSRETEMKPIQVKTRSEIERFKPIVLGIGYGQSHGGFGGFIQLNTKSGFAFHGGVGYFPASLFYSEYDWVSNTVLFSGGLKYYLPLDADPIYLYLDLQFGGIGVEAYQFIVWDWYSGLYLDTDQKTLWGPSLLGGLEIKMGMIGINGALGISYNITEVEWSDQNFFFTLDCSLLVYF